MTKKICNVLSMVVFLGLLVIAGFLFVPKMLGYDEYAVLSGSMEPGIPVGAIVYDKNFTGSEARDGAVVTYQLPAGTLVTHRIISVDKEEQTVVTQGDANNIADAAPVAWQQIIGVYAFHIPYLGYISIYAKTPLGIAVVCGVLIVLILLNFIPDILEEDKKKISDTEIVDGARDYRLMTRQFVNSLLELEEYNRFSKGLYGWVGYKTKWMEYENVERVAGETKWSFWKLFVYAIEGIVAFSTVPLLISAIMGIVFCVLAFILIIVIVAKTLIFGDPTSGWPSMVCIMLFIGGIQLFCIGILGEYFAKAYMELKKRPIFICKETNIQP